jgi:hypothetical protein
MLGTHVEKTHLKRLFLQGISMLVLRPVDLSTSLRVVGSLSSSSTTRSSRHRTQMVVAVRLKAAMLIMMMAAL